MRVKAEKCRRLAGLGASLFRWTRSASCVPFLQKLDQLGHRVRSWLPPRPWRPAPVDQLVVCDVLCDLNDSAITVARWVFDLGTDLGARFAEPLHRYRRK